MNKKQTFIFKNVIFLLTVIGLLFSLSCRQKLTTTSPAPPNRHLPQNFLGKKGMVVAAHPLAAKAGLQVLRDGGNAVDAAVATAFALNAAEPFASGIGGGGFMVIYLAEKDTVTVINYREKAPSKASPKMFMEEGKTNRALKRTSGLAVGVPGALAGWALALDKYGTKPLSDVIRGGIKIAEEGYSISKTFSKINKDEYEKILQNAGEESCYLNNGFPYEPGDRFRNPELAGFFKTLASNGIDEFYKGETAQKIINAVKEKDGIMTLEDLARYKPVETKPVRGSYKGFSFFSAPPPCSGGLHIIQLLNIIENWPIKNWGANSAEYVHHFSEAFRFVFADRAQYLGDPEFIEIPVENLISKKYAAGIAAKIKPDKSQGSYPFGIFENSQKTTDNTTHLCVIDKDKNIVSLTQSINHFFGSGIVPEKTGFLLNNHMDDFSSDPESPNAPRANRRPVSSMGPLIMFKDNKPFLILGSPGGTRIFPSLTQIIVNIIDFKMSIDEAIEAPRFFSYSTGGKARPIFMESRILQTTVKALEKMGHEVSLREAFDKYFGGAQGILLPSGKKVILGGADSRRDGFGAGY